MAEPWSGQSLQALPATVLGALGALGSEFLREWETQDMRVTLFKLLLLWLVLSLLGIQLAWGFYGNTVTGLYHRPGLGGQNGSTPDGSTHFPSCTLTDHIRSASSAVRQELTNQGIQLISTSTRWQRSNLAQKTRATQALLKEKARDLQETEMAANESLKTHRE
uniref:T-cell leukemia translocation-altered gene protein isoform X1 n=1 Tax=Jaculus jaculus TaxID=51337 RepID=UPI001E1B5188|nr:T-cell leukemia translocation-altered gene protein isoform X1 [Jaculus jaculus]